MKQQLDLNIDIAAEFRKDVVTGLSKDNKSIPSKYFYDANGSKLFNQICRLDEYYLTRTELAIMKQYSADMARQIGPDAAIIEFGAGNYDKAKLLLSKLNNPSYYMPVDISPTALLATSEEISKSFPMLSVVPICSDYTKDFLIPKEINQAKKVAYYPGSTISNFTPDEALLFLKKIKHIVGEGGLLIGVDLIKEQDVFFKAYNDSLGVTEKFNKNVLLRANKELGANFDLEKFSHYAPFNEKQNRVEMHLVSSEEQQISINDECFEFSKGEGIHTENSYKYTVDMFASIASSAGFSLNKAWTDDKKYFSMQYYV